MILWILVLIFSFGLSSGGRFFRVGLNLFQPTVGKIQHTLTIELQTSNNSYSLTTPQYSEITFFTEKIGTNDNPITFSLLENEMPKKLIITDSFKKGAETRSGFDIPWNKSAAAVGRSVLGGSLKLTYSFQVTAKCMETTQYTCGSKLRKICKKGWINPNKNCMAPRNCQIQCGNYQTACFKSNTGQCICYFKNRNKIWTKGPNDCQKIPLQRCTTGYCQNGGRCQTSSEGFGCRCKFGFRGEKCELDTCSHVGANSIPPIDCTANAICKVKSIGKSCTCTIGSAGRSCAKASKSCEPDTCLNGGICTRVKRYKNEGDQFLCYCKNGYGGQRCQNAHKFCDMATTLCGKKEICLNILGNHRCIKMPENKNNSTQIRNDTVIV